MCILFSLVTDFWGFTRCTFSPPQAYDFLYKPGNISGPPPFVAPHQPRLDWQMWFAALGGYEQAPWFINFAYRLLEWKQEGRSVLIDQNQSKSNQSNLTESMSNLPYVFF